MKNSKSKETIYIDNTSKININLGMIDNTSDISLRNLHMSLNMKATQ